VGDTSMWFTTVPTYGSMMIGFGLIARHLIDWWPGEKGVKEWRNWVSLVPFLLAYSFGILLILGVGGLIGTVANFTLWGVGWVGDGALIWGVGGERQAIGHGGQRMALTNGGLSAVLFLSFVFAGLQAKSERLRVPLTRGCLSGVLTGTVAGISAFMAVPVASAVNRIGDFLPTVGS
jgi:hypothetical protein